MTTQIEPGCLSKLIEKGTVKILDGSWALDGTDMQALYKADHVSGAYFFDLEAISDHSTPLPHMAPSPAQFAGAVGHMGISENDHVVIYDRQGLFSSARVWWTFKLMGHDKVQILRGGLPAWKTAGLPVTNRVPTPVPTTYVPRFMSEKIINIDNLHNALKVPGNLVLDARPHPRFEGTVSEPRAGLRSGHMPGSRNLPFGDLLRDGALKPREEMEVIFQTYDIESAKTIITTCGSGVTAAIISLALHEIGHTDTLLYDGSWAEWGQDVLDTPVITGS